MVMEEKAAADGKAAMTMTRITDTRTTNGMAAVGIATTTSLAAATRDMAPAGTLRRAAPYDPDGSIPRGQQYSGG